MSAASNCRLIGRWRIVEADLWDRNYLDLVEPAAVTIGPDGHGKIAFGAMQASLDLGYSPKRQDRRRSHGAVPFADRRPQPHVV